MKLFVWLQQLHACNDDLCVISLSFFSFICVILSCIVIQFMISCCTLYLIYSIFISFLYDTINFTALLCPCLGHDLTSVSESNKCVCPFLFPFFPLFSPYPMWYLHPSLFVVACGSTSIVSCVSMHAHEGCRKSLRQVPLQKPQNIQAPP